MAKSFTLEEVDKLLNAWQAKRTSASANVLELMDQTTYQHLTGTGGFKGVVLKGLTETRCTPALKAFSELWALFAELGKVLDLAQDKRNALPARPRSAQIDEIGELLCGPSVKFSSQLPFSQRTLLSSAEVTTGMTLERVMETMIKAYDDGKAVVVEIDALVTTLHKSLQKSISDTQALRTTAEALGLGDLPELEGVEARVNLCLDSIYSDPLGVNADFAAQIDPLLTAATSRVNGLKEIYEQILRDMELARTTLKSLKETHGKAVAAEAERKLKVWLEDGDSLPAPPAEAAVLEIEAWLGRLEVSLERKKWQALRTGVANWSLQATERLLACQKACSANLEPLNQRQVLRGYLDALKAKAQMNGRSEDEELGKIELAARALLYTRPTRLVEAEKLVQQYAGNLR